MTNEQKQSLLEDCRAFASPVELTGIVEFETAPHHKGEISMETLRCLADATNGKKVTAYGVWDSNGRRKDVEEKANEPMVGWNGPFGIEGSEFSKMMGGP